MTAILYYLFLYPLSLLPLRILYGVSGVFYLLLWYCIPYRKKVVFKNLHSSFPEKSDQEIKQIAKEFYKHFCDVLVETLKSFSIKRSLLQERVSFRNIEVFHKYYEAKRSVIICAGHQGNWEWGALGFSINSLHKAYGMYMPLKNKFFDAKARSSRGRFDMELISAKEAFDFFSSQKDKVFSIGMIADQSPNKIKKAHWTTFLNQETAVLTGVERYAKEFNIVVLFGEFRKIGRSRFEVILHEITSDAPNTEEGFITEKYTRLLEKAIQNQPAYWLWTHKRWKRKKPAID